MTENELNQKIEQCENDIKTLQNNLITLQIQKEQLLNWVVAVSGDRVILNLAALNLFARDSLTKALEVNAMWISFDRKGRIGAVASKTDRNGLKFYDKTKIIFG